MAAQRKQRRAGGGVRAVAQGIGHQRDPAGFIRMASPFVRHQVVVHGLGARVVDQVVDHGRVHTALEQRVAFTVAGVDVAEQENAAGVVVHQRAFGVFALFVYRVAQAFVDEVVAVGDVMRCGAAPGGSVGAIETRAAHREVFVSGPGKAAVVDDDLARAAAGGDAVVVVAAALGSAIATGAEHQVLHDHVVRGDVEFALDQRHARAGCGLASQRDEGVADGQRLAFEVNDPAHFKHHQARTCGFDGRAERAQPATLQVGDLHDAPATATHRSHGPAGVVIGGSVGSGGRWRQRGGRHGAAFGRTIDALQTRHDGQQGGQHLIGKQASTTRAQVRAVKHR